MDVKRIIILIPLAIVAYLLIVQWNQDYHQPHAPSQQAPTLAEANRSDAHQPEDVLKAPESSRDRASSPSDNATETREDDAQPLVQVSTDVLDIRIDPHGGDVVYAALPQHKESLNSTSPFVLMNDSKSLSYVARSGVELNGRTGVTFTPEQTQYRLSDDQQTLAVDLKGEQNGVAIIKRFTFTRGQYGVKVEYLLNNQTDAAVSARFVGQLARDNSADPTNASGIGMHSYLGAAFSTSESRYQKVSLSDIHSKKFKEIESQGGWVAMIQHYFVSAWVPSASDHNLYYTQVDRNDRAVAAFASNKTSIAAGQQADLSAELYLGPKTKSQLDAVAPNLDLTIDYGWLWFLASPLFWLLSKIHGLIGNWGWSIVLLTCVVKAILLPLSAKAYRSMAKMRKLGPEMNRIKEEHGSDRQKMSQEMMKFYQKEKINPLGGCLPMVIQMPVFIALYWMLMESVELRHAPFMLWIKDLSAMDPYFILPIIMGLSMFLQQQLNPAPQDPTQAKVMKLLPIIFTFFFLWFPAGLVVYWITNNILSIAQQYLITRQIEKSNN